MLTLHHIATDRFMYLCLCSVKYLYNIMFCLLQNKHTFISIVIPAQLNSINRNYRKFTCKSYFADILENLIKIKRSECIVSVGGNILQGIVNSYIKTIPYIQNIFLFVTNEFYYLYTWYGTVSPKHLQIHLISFALFLALMYLYLISVLK